MLVSCVPTLFRIALMSQKVTWPTLSMSVMLPMPTVFPAFLRIKPKSANAVEYAESLTCMAIHPRSFMIVFGVQRGDRYALRVYRLGEEGQHLPASFEVE